MEVHIETGQGRQVILGLAMAKEDAIAKAKAIVSKSSYQISPQEMLSFIDLTSLGDSDNEQTIQSLCTKAKAYQTAAICVYPQFTLQCKKLCPEVPLAVVGPHFPQKDKTVSSQEALGAIENGANEVDILIGPSLACEKKFQEIYNEVHSWAQICNRYGILLKVILESGTIEDPQLISIMSKISIIAGADFIKTSSGKAEVGATWQAAYTILEAIKQSKRPIGFKPSGGIKTYHDALPYFQLAHDILGPDAICSKRFRLGASGLAQDLSER